MSENTWSFLAGILWMIDFLGGLTLVGIGFLTTFENAANGWLEIGMGILFVLHAYLIFHSKLDEEKRR